MRTSVPSNAWARRTIGIATWTCSANAFAHPTIRSFTSPRRAVELLGAQLARDAVEHGVDHADLLALDEGMCNVDIFGNHDARRNVTAVIELVGAGSQHRAQDRLDAL